MLDYLETGLRACGCTAATCLFKVTNCLAADIAVVSPVPLKAPPPSQFYDWSGSYVGGHLGYAALNSDWTANSTQAVLAATAGLLTH